VKINKKKEEKNMKLLTSGYRNANVGGGGGGGGKLGGGGVGVH